MGKMCRHLLEKEHCKIFDEHNAAIENLDSTSIPYALRIYEDENPFASAMIVQDASVVRNPFADNVDPAVELLTTLEEVWEKGISLVVCTNRGVIEKAYRDRYLDRSYNTKIWFKILREFVQNGDITSLGDLRDNCAFDCRKPVFDESRVSYSFLDNHSLLVGSNIFDNLVKKATNDSYWMECCKCEQAALCPFKLNRDWLINDEARTMFLNVLCRAEILSGQIIVLREALAFISLLLAGCPRDYGNIHPCKWVQQKVEANDIFALSMRRLYMSLYSSYTRYGLEINSSLYKRQVDGITTLRSLIEDNDCIEAKIIDQVLTGASPSTDVGVERLVGVNGILKEIDPWRECLPPQFIDEWDGDLRVISSYENTLYSELEKRCTNLWSYLEELIEYTPSHETSLCHWSLRRWSSNFLIHFGSLMEGMTSWANELDEFITILETLVKDPSSRSPEERRRIGELDRQLELLLAAKSGDHATYDVIPLSESVLLSGRWVADNLRPRIDTRKVPASFQFL